MSPRKTTAVAAAPEQPAYDPDKMYRVRLTKVVELNGAKLLPRYPVFVRGRYLDGLKDSILRIEAD